MKLLEFECHDETLDLEPEPDVVRLLKEALDLAGEGKIVGFTFLGQTPDGEYITSWAYPRSTILSEVLGQLEQLKFQAWDSAS